MVKNSNLETIKDWQIYICDIINKYQIVYLFLVNDIVYL